MPYIVTTKRPYGGPANRLIPVSRRAVATLEEAHPYLEGLLSALIPWPSDPQASHAAAAWIRSVTQDEVFAPFTTSDGTVIEVERTDWPTLSDLPGAEVFAEPAANWQHRVLDAFNARQHP